MPYENLEELRSVAGAVEELQEGLKAAVAAQEASSSQSFVELQEVKALACSLQELQEAGRESVPERLGEVSTAIQQQLPEEVSRHPELKRLSHRVDELDEAARVKPSKDASVHLELEKLCKRMDELQEATEGLWPHPSTDAPAHLELERLAKRMDEMQVACQRTMLPESVEELQGATTNQQQSQEDAAAWMSCRRPPERCSHSHRQMHPCSLS
eukprot:TRINITY_DN5068_c0_g1_i3.p2 TRINITY_DN5068_c0_g1~~TRINITY_DN5068_c0_g1_i3.p2  ORF type:complete len:213 (+),score=76.83 TRINITY_DN5068_c0_g1_i3:992-1630(+)